MKLNTRLVPPAGLRAIRAVSLLAVFCWPPTGVIAQGGQAPMGFPWAAGAGTLPQNAGSIFLPVEVFPRASDTTVPPLMPCALLRCSGLFGFRDPTTGREYAVSGRSDGLMLMDCTPAFPPGSGQPLRLVTIPTTNQLDWLDEPGSGTPGIPLSSQPKTVVTHNLLNGFTVQNEAYWPPLSPYPYPFRTTHTPNREVTVWRDVSADRFWVFSVNTMRAGVWAVPLVRTNGVQRFDAANAAWLQPTNVGACHHIYLDGDHQRLFVTDDWNFDTLHAVVALQIQPGAANATGILAMTPAWTYSPTAQRRVWNGTSHVIHPADRLHAHDAMPAGNYLYVTYGDYWEPDISNPTDAGWSLIDILSLEAQPQLKNRLKLGPPNAPLSGLTFPLGHDYEGLQSRWPTLAGSHSVYVEASNVPEPSLWVTQEDATPVSWSSSTGYATARVSAVRFSYSDPKDDPKFREATRMVLSEGQAPPPNYLPTRMHYIRGVGRVGVVAHYNDGIDLVDLSEVHDQSSNGWFTSSLAVLGSFDTSFEAQPLQYSYPNSSSQWGPPNTLQGNLDAFLGCWDAYPHQESGLVYASCGQSGVAVFQVQQGQMNRFGAATPFATGAASAGKFPRIELMSGPARQGRPIVIHDGNRGSFVTDVGGTPVKYTYRLRYSAAEQFGIDSSYQPFTNPTPVPTVGQMYLTGTSYVDLPFSDSDVIITAPMPTQGTPVFGQFIVQEHRFVGSWQPTGYWAASQATWCGVAKP